jgi:hypothetical protein
MEFVAGLLVGLFVGGTIAAIMVGSMAAAKLADLRREYEPHGR